MTAEHYSRVDLAASHTALKRELTLLLALLWDDRTTRTIALFAFALVSTMLALFMVTDVLRDNSMLARQIHFAIHIGSDDSLSETLGHGLAFFAAASFLICFLDCRSRTALFLAVLCGFIWLDDAAQYHERVGSALSDAMALDAAFGLRAQDFGELLAWAVAAGLLLALLIWALRKRLGGDMGLLLAAGLCFGFLALFGIVFDMLHVLFQSRIFTVIEDGGELFALAAFCALGLGMTRVHGDYILDEDATSL